MQLTSRVPRIITAAVASSALVGTILVGAAPANAANPGLLTASQEESVRATMDSVSIDARIQDELIAKLNAGQLLDSQTDAAPVRTTTEYTEDGLVRTVDVFLDGSQRWIESDVPAVAQARGLNPSKSGCKSSGGWYTGCKVGIADLVSNAGFFADYTTNRIRDVRGKYCNNSVGNASCSASLKRATASSAGPAWAELSFVAGVGPIGNVSSGAFGLRVSGNSASLYG
jgi:hypothetical protein